MLGEKLQSYNIYKKPIINRHFRKNNQAIQSELYFSSRDRIKADKTKIAMAMGMFAQINIIDIKTGTIKGLRIANTPDFTYLTKDPKAFREFYIDINIDDYHIFCLYLDKLIYGNERSSYSANELHVFNWKGDFFYKIILDKHSSEIAFDPVKKQLYSLTPEDLLYSYDLSFLY